MKIGFFITARMKSSRLTHKVLLDLNGKSVIDRVIERCKSVKGIDGVVLCTSHNPQDSILYDSAVKNNIQFYIGSEVDVLDRLLNAALYYGYDAFVSITADNPLFSIYTSQILVDWNKREDFDFIFSKGLPIGCCTSLINVKALQVAVGMKKAADTEIWGPFVNRPDFFNVGQLVVTNSPFKEEKRLTCDYPEDYQLFRRLYSFYDSSVIPSLHETLQTLVEHPHLWDLNKMHVQKAPTDIELSQIAKTFNEQISNGLDIAKQLGKTMIPSYKELSIEI
jgi:spore coat polysaccharide biosynthesis protein SpsF